jgi:hypothetical protein
MNVIIYKILNTREQTIFLDNIKAAFEAADFKVKYSSSGYKFMLSYD